MFVHDFLQVRRPYPDVLGRLAADTTWLRVSARAAHLEALELHRAEVVGAEGLDALALPPTPLLTLGELREGVDSARLPLSWGPQPAWLDGDLEASPIGARRTQLSVSARAALPVGVLGRRRDELLFARVCEAGVRSFLARVAGTLELGDESATA